MSVRQTSVSQSRPELCIVFSCHVSFKLEWFLSFPWLSWPWYFWKLLTNYFEEGPSTFVWHLLVNRLRLCTFGRKPWKWCFIHCLASYQHMILVFPTACNVKFNYFIEVVSASLLYCKVSLFPLINNECFVVRYFETMKIFHLSSSNLFIHSYM